MNKTFFHVGGLDVLWDPEARVAVYHLPGTDETHNVPMTAAMVATCVRQKAWIPKDQVWPVTYRSLRTWRRAARQQGLFVLEYEFFLLARSTTFHDAGWFDRRFRIGGLRDQIRSDRPDFPEPRLK